MDTSDIVKNLKNIKKSEDSKSKKEKIFDMFYTPEVVDVSIKDNCVLVTLSDGNVIKSNEVDTSANPDEIINIVKSNIEKLDLEKPLSKEDIIKLFPKQITVEEIKKIVKDNTPKIKDGTDEFIAVAKEINSVVEKKTDELKKQIPKEKSIKEIRKELEELYLNNKLDAKKYIKNLPTGKGGDVVRNVATKYLEQIKNIDYSGLEIVDGKYVLGSGSGGGGSWGSIAGTLSDQTDLQNALDSKVNGSQVLTNVPENAVFTDTVYDDTAIQAQVDLNTAKVSFPEAPEDGKQYARIDGTWVEVSGGGGGVNNEKLQRIAVGGSLAFRPNSIVKKGNNLYACEQGKIFRFTRLSPGGDFIPNNGNTGSSGFFTPSINAETIFSVSGEDNYIYAVIFNATRSVIRIDLTDFSETAITYSGQSPINTNKRFISKNDSDMVLCLEESSASQSIIRKYRLIGTELVNQNEDYIIQTANGLTPLMGVKTVGSTLCSNDCIYHLYSGELVIHNLIDNTQVKLTDYQLVNTNGRGMGQGVCFFECDGYVYSTNHLHDSEDFTGIELTVIDKI